MTTAAYDGSQQLLQCPLSSSPLVSERQPDRQPVFQITKIEQESYACVFVKGHFLIFSACFRTPGIGSHVENPWPNLPVGLYPSALSDQSNSHDPTRLGLEGTCPRWHPA